MLSRLVNRRKKHSAMPVQLSEMDRVDHSFNLLKSATLEVAAAAASAADVLEQEQERIKACFTALNSASDIIFIVDNDENVFFVNDMFIERFHFNNHRDVVGQNMHKVLPSLDNYGVMWKSVRSNKIWEDTFCNDQRLTVVPMMNGRIEPIYYICTIKQPRDDSLHR